MWTSARVGCRAVKAPRMDMHSREQYLERVREEYRKADKKSKTRLLNEARKRTRLNRKVLIGKLAHPAVERRKKKRGPRQATYSRAVQAAMIKVWEVFDYPCGQRLAPALRQEIERLRKAKELVCSEDVAGKLKTIFSETVYRRLGRGGGLLGVRGKPDARIHSTLVAVNGSC